MTKTGSRRRARIVAVIPLIGLVFWLTALMASTIPGLLVLGVNVHGLGLAGYSGESGAALAPLSQRIITEAKNDSGLTATSSPSASVISSAGPSGSASGVAGTPGSTATPAPSPSASATPITSILTSPIASILPSPTPSPTPTPTPTPTPSKSSITGQVLDTVTHLGIAAATVAITGGASTLTDVNGNFSFSVNPGTYTLTASATGYTSASQTVTVNGGQTLGVSFKLVSLTATGGIKGQVTNSVTAAAIVGATVMLSNGLSTVTDLSGTYSFPVVPYGTYTLAVSAVGYVSQSQSVTVKPGHTTTLNFQLVP